MKLTTEGLLTSRQAFGVRTATPVQRASCRIRDGLPLGKLAKHPDVVAALGGELAIASLPSERGVKPVEFCDVSSPRTAKTIRAVAGALVATQTVDVSKLGPGEVPRVSIVSLTRDVADVPFRLLIGTVEASPMLRPLLISKTADAALFRHPSGRPIEVAVVAGARAGASLVARWSAGVIFDEAPRMLGQEDGIVNLDDARSAVLDRLLPGAVVQYIGSPWAPLGPCFEMVKAHWGAPTGELVVLRCTGPAGNPSHWTPEFCERLRRQDANAYAVGVLGEFVDATAGLLTHTAVKRCTRTGPDAIPPIECGACTAAIDPSGASSSGNGFTLVIVDARHIAGRVVYRVVQALEWRGCGPEIALKEVGDQCRAYGVRHAFTDEHAGAIIVALARNVAGLTLIEEKSSQAGNLEAFTNLANLVATDSIEFSPKKAFERDLLSVRKTATPLGWKIVLPHTADGRHCDYAPALARAVAHARVGSIALSPEAAPTTFAGGWGSNAWGSEVF